MTPRAPQADLTPDCIVVGVDGSEDAGRAVTWAADQADLERRPLLLVHTADVDAVRWAHSTPGSPRVSGSDLRRAFEATARTALSDAALLARVGHPRLEVIEDLVDGDPRDVLLQAARHARMLVVGSRGRGRAASLLLGSVSAAVAASATCPVTVVRYDTGAPASTRVLVGVHRSGGSPSAIKQGFTQASLRGLPLCIAVSHFDAESDHPLPRRPLTTPDDLARFRSQLEELTAGCQAAYPDVAVTLDLTTATFGDLVSGAADAGDLVVIGRRIGTPLDRVVGHWSTLAIVEASHGVVIVVPEAR